MNYAIVVAWHNEKQKDEFLEAWRAPKRAEYLFLTQDTDKSGCAKTKNRGIRNALDSGAEYIIVLDDDCYPTGDDINLVDFAQDHIAALQPQPVKMVFPTTDPPSRGTPYRHRDIKMKVAASMGFWNIYPDFDAMSALVHGEKMEIAHAIGTIYQRYFPFCGMNFAFHRDQFDCAVLIDVPRFDDIWMGWIWEKVAYEKGLCFNLSGPRVNHVRQSKVWENLQQEVKYLELNEDLWEAIHRAPRGLTAETLRRKFFGKIP
jgi:reversibly glycosylated polypeptide